MKKYLVTGLLLAVSFFGGVSVVQAQTTAPVVEKVTSASPVSLKHGETLTIRGSGFNKKTRIHFMEASNVAIENSRVITPMFIDNTKISFVIPNDLSAKFHYIFIGENPRDESITGVENIVVFTVLSNSSPVGTITVSPNPCILENGQDACIVNLSWEAKQTPSDVQIRTNEGKVIFRGKNGNGRVKSGFTYSLWHNLTNNGGVATELDSVFVSSVTSTSTINSDTIPVITSIQSVANPTGTINAGEKAFIYGTGLSGASTLIIGNLEKYIMNIFSTSYTSAEFIVPARRQSISTNISVMNSAGFVSDSYPVYINSSASVISKPMTITSIQSVANPINTVDAGGIATIYGSGFNNNSLVHITGVSGVQKISYTNSNITFRVPSILSDGAHTIRVREKAGDGTNDSNAISFGVNSLGTSSSLMPVPPLTPTSKPTPTPVSIRPRPRLVTPPQTMFTSNMWRGMQSPDVKRLQQAFNSDPATRIAESGAGSPGNETEYFGFVTELAVQNFQCKHKIVCSGTPDSTGYGVVGRKTRAVMNDVFGGKKGTVTPTVVQPRSSVRVPTLPSSEVTPTAPSLEDKIGNMLKQLLELQLQLKKMQGAILLNALRN